MNSYSHFTLVLHRASCVLVAVTLALAAATANAQISTSSARAAVGDACLASGIPAGHAVFLPGIDPSNPGTPGVDDGYKYIFSPAGTFTEDANAGTATLTAHAESTLVAGFGWDIEANFTGRNPNGVKIRELKDECYVENGGTVDPATWYTYDSFTGTMTGTGNYAGAVLHIVWTMHNFQVGKNAASGATGKNVDPGAAGWFKWTVVSQPSNGMYTLVDSDDINYAGITYGDFNFNLCSGTIGDYVWQDTNGDGCQDPNEVGIPGVQVDLYQGCAPGGMLVATTHTDADGKYLFTGLCAGDYTVSFHTPDGYTRTLANQNCNIGGVPSDETDSDCNCQGTEVCGVCVTLTADDSEDLTIDCGYVPVCDLSITKECLPPPPVAGDFDCSDAKPIDRVILRWNGATSPIYVKAWNGSVGSGTPMTYGPIATGERLTFTRSGSFPNDIYFELFSNSIMNAGSKLGESKFHLSCSDSEMNGPEDCGNAEGDGKGNDSGFINDWGFEGMGGSGLFFDCSPVLPPGSVDCSIPVAPMADCESAGKPDVLVFRYTGGGCGASTNLQEGKFTCTGSVNPGEAVSITTDNNKLTVSPATVAPGGEFSVSGDFGSQTGIQLSNSGGSQFLSIHTSCSKPLVAGDVFGDATLVSINGQTGGSSIIYRYTVSNNGSTALSDVEVSDDKLGPIAGPVSLDPGQSMTFDRLVQLTETTQNIATAVGKTVAGDLCTVMSGPVMVTVMQNCPVWSSDLVFHDKKLERDISNTGLTDVTMTGVTVSWPSSNKRLKKVKLDGDTLWDEKSPVGATSITLTSGDLTSDTKKKTIKAGDTKEFVLEFEEDAVPDVNLYSVTVSFGANCTLTIP